MTWGFQKNKRKHWNGKFSKSLNSINTASKENEGRMYWEKKSILNNSVSSWD